jgi:hypothetical protein
MRRPEEVRLVQELTAEGLNACEVARRTGIPRTTVRDWVAGRLPHRDPEGFSCSTCGHRLHRPDELPAADYSYLLGVYLGDGCISRAPRDVYRLRIACDMKYPSIIREVSATILKVMPSSRIGVAWNLGGGNGAEVYS